MLALELNMSIIERATAYTGEAWLMRWSENPQGRTITLQLAEDGDSHPFKGMKFGAVNGQRFQVAIVCAADDKTPQDIRDAKNGPVRDTPPVATPFAEAKGQDKPRTLSQEAALYCRRTDFQTWLGVKSEDEAANRLRFLCQISSRSELDTNAHAAQDFRDIVARFRAEWMGEK